MSKYNVSPQISQEKLRRLFPKVKYVLAASEEAQDAIPQSLFSSRLGEDRDTGQEVRLGDEERQSGLYILGKPGMGKTTLMVNLILQDIEHGHGLCFLDPHGDAIEDIVKRLPEHRKQDVILLDPLDKEFAFGLNLFHCENPKDAQQFSDTLNTVLEIFSKLFTKDGDLEDAPALFDTLINVTILLLHNPGYTLTDVPLLLTNREAVKNLLSNIDESYEEVRQWWTEYNSAKTKPDEREKKTGSTRRRLQRFLANGLVRHVVGQPTTIDMRSIMDEGKILLVKLPRKQPQVVTLIGSLLIDRILHAAYSRDEIPKEKRRHFCLYCDEFQNYATPDFARLITEGRKYKIAVTIAHQERLSQLGLEDKNRGATLATANQVFFQLTVPDSKELSPEFARKPEPASVELLEEESVEVLKEAQIRILEDEWYEEIEVSDGVEPIMALAQDPFDRLSTVHSHPQVEKLSEGLRRLTNAMEVAQAETEQAGLEVQKISQERVFEQTIDGITYRATRQQLLQGKHLINQLLVDIEHGIVAYGSPEMRYQLADIAVVLRAFIGFAQAVGWNEKSKGTVVHDYGRDVYVDIPVRGDWKEVELDEETSRYLLMLTETIVREVPGSYEGTEKSVVALSANRATQDLQKARLLSHIQAKEKARYEHFFDGYRAEDVYITVPAAIAEVDDFLTLPAQIPERDRQMLLMRRRSVLEQSQSLAKGETRRLLHFLSELAGLCLALSSPQQHIRVPSNQYQERKRTQIIQHPRLTVTDPPIVLSHPRREMHYPQRSYQDMEAEMAHELRNLPPYTAYAKMREEVEGQQRVSKYQFQPDNVWEADDETVVKKRRRSIRANTFKQRYYIEREAVRQAIAQRRAELLQRETPKAQATSDDDE